MKNFHLLFAAIVAVCMFISCSKDVNVEIIRKPTQATEKLKSYIEEVHFSGEQKVTAFSLKYDASGRLTNWVSETTSGEKFSYKYLQGAYITEYFCEGKLVMNQTTMLNAAMQIDSTVQSYDESSNLTEKYKYNSAGQLIAINQYHNRKSFGASLYNTRRYSYNEGGNVSREEDGSSVTTYEYYNNFSCNTFIAAPYVQKPNNLVKTTTYTSGNEREVFNHTYTFDNNNRLVAEKISKAGTSDIIIRKFGY